MDANHKHIDLRNSMNPSTSKKITPKHTIIKLLKVNDKGKTEDKIHADTLHTEEQIKIVDSLSEIIQERRKWHNIFKVMKVRICEPRLLYLIKLSERKAK